ncbi:nitroreductase family protein [Candidatus Peregrinibacteria bacterium]|nr:MAG: nitroreductase family protein [Candidatus Peregrinibacteria bacterium]
MDFQKLIKQRRATHHFLPDREVTDEQFKQIIEMVRYTPSGYNAQPWEFILIRDAERLKEIQKIAFDQAHVGQASAAVAIVGDTNLGRNKEAIVQSWIDYGYCTEAERGAYLNSIGKKRSDDKLKGMALRNASLAAMMFMLAAEEIGLSTCPMMGFSQWQMEEFLGLPDDRIVIMLMALGYADRSQEKPQLPRKSVEEMIYLEEFGKRLKGE